MTALRCRDAEDHEGDFRACTFLFCDASDACRTALILTSGDGATRTCPNCEREYDARSGQVTEPHAAD